MAGTKKFKPEQVVAAIISENGVLSGAADRLGCDVRSIYNYRDEFDEVAQAIEDARENHDCELLDKAERNLSCLLYTSPSPRDQRGSRMPSSA